MPPPVFRFAPSPNGYLHLGHAYSALLNFDLARRSGGAKSLSADERRRLTGQGAPFALRLDMAAAISRAGNLTWTEQGEGPEGLTGTISARPKAWGDVILARKETPTSYHLAVVVDD